MRREYERRSRLRALSVAANDFERQAAAEDPGADVVAGRWLFALRRYVSIMLAGNLTCEFAHTPLYTLWRTESSGTAIWSVIHCTVGDLIIGGVALVTSLVLAGRDDWPQRRFFAVGVLTIFLGLGYTLYSEWLNVYVRQSWAYTEAMPVIFGIGVTPVLQWLVVPTLAFFAIRRRLGAWAATTSMMCSRTRPF